MDLDAGHRGLERRCPQIEQAGRTGADQDDPSLYILPGHFAGQHLPGREIGGRIAGTEFHDDDAVGVGRDFEIADLHVVEAGVLAERGLAAGVRGLEHIAARALRDAQQLGRERGHQRIADPKDQRRPAHDLVAIRDPVDGADPVRGRIKNRQISGRPPERGHQPPRIIARNGKPGLGGRRGVCAAAEARRKHARRLFQRGRKGLVIGGLTRRFLHQHVGLHGGQMLDDLLDRGAVGLGEQDIEADDRGAFAGQLDEEVAHLGSRPRPLPELRQRFFVDVDDADRQPRIVGLRRELLIGIEGDQAQRTHEERIHRAHQRRRRQERQDEEEVEARRGNGHVDRRIGRRGMPAFSDQDRVLPLTQRLPLDQTIHGTRGAKV